MSKEKKTVYIAGKMRGVAYHNFPKFDFCVIAIAASVLYAIVRALLK